MTWGRTAATDSTLLLNGDVLVVGASAAGIIVSTAQIFTPSTNSWTDVPPDAQGTRYNFSKVLTLPSGKALAFAKTESPESLSSAGRIYDSLTRSWSPPRPLAHARFGGFSATLLRNGNVLIAGGVDPNPNAVITAAAELYIP
jgi:hypothetical protein